MTGVLDEPAHLATAALVLLALGGWSRLVRYRLAALVVLAASVAIDVDHIALYAGVPHVASHGRPYTHSLATVVLLLLGAAGCRRGRGRGRGWSRGRTVLVAAAAGVCLHFLRDVATGPGLPLWWPLTGANVLLPYRWYVWALVTVSLVAAVRLAVSGPGSSEWRSAGSPCRAQREKWDDLDAGVLDRR